MAPRIAIAFLLVILFASPLIAIKSFDFYYLVLMWPGAYCAQSKTCCVPTSGLPIKDFFLGGLLTYNSTTMQPVTKCSQTSFYRRDLASMRGALNIYWSNIKCPNTDGESLWRSAWKTYGVCTSMNETDYFEAVLDLRAKFDVLSLLKRKGIYPNYRLYELTEIKSAIAEGIGAMPEIRCSKGPFNLYQLYQVYICLDKSGKVMECPAPAGFTCSSQILFHPFEYWMLTKNSTNDTGCINMPVSME